MYKKMVRVSVILSLLVLMLSLGTHEVHAVLVGSDTAVSRQTSFILFPSTDSNNEIRGFAAVEGGFKLATNTTTCTFNAYLPVSGEMHLSGGQLFLNKDLTFGNVSSIASPGTIRANNRALIFPEGAYDRSLPGGAGDIAALIQSDLGGAKGAMDRPVNAVSWASDGTYVAGASASTSSGTEFYLWPFNGTTFGTPFITGLGAGQAGNMIRGNLYSNAYYLVACSTSGALPKQLQLLYFDGATITSPAGAAMVLNGNGLACAWHPSNKFVLSGSDNTTVGEGELCLFSCLLSGGTTSLTLTYSLPMSPLRRAVNALSFSPGGNYLAVGTAENGTNNTLNIYKFNGSTLAYDCGIYTGAPIHILDWSNTGTYIVVGMSSGADAVRVYAHNAAAKTVTDVTTARTGETAPVHGVAWNNRGKTFVYTTDNATNSKYKAYYFDDSSGAVTKTTEFTSVVPIYDVRWSFDGNYIARGDNTSNNLGYVTVSGISYVDLATLFGPLVFDGATIYLNSGTFIGSDVRMRGECKVFGCGKKLSLGDYKIDLLPSARVTFQNMSIEGLAGYNLRCWGSDCSITFDDCTLTLSSDYTFSTGSFVIKNDVVISGTNKFIYRSATASTISSGAILTLDNGITFSYAPIIANKNLIVMSDVSSGLYLNGATIVSTTTGLRLSTGTLYLDNDVTFSSQAKNSGEAMELNSNVNIQALAGSVLDVFGFVKYV